MQLRTARPDDLDLLLDWDSRAHVIAASGADDDDYDWETELPRRVAWREFLVAEIDGRPVGFLQIIDPREEETHYWGDVQAGLRAIDIWIGEESDLGRGYGTRMMELAVERCFADPAVSAVLVDPLESNTRACRFYEKLGFVPVGQRRFGMDDCVVYSLSRARRSKRLSATMPATRTLQPKFDT